MRLKVNSIGKFEYNIMCDSGLFYLIYFTKYSLWAKNDYWAFYWIPFCSLPDSSIAGKDFDSSMLRRDPFPIQRGF